jgi:hypothetical protein
MVALHALAAEMKDASLCTPDSVVLIGMLGGSECTQRYFDPTKVKSPWIS